MNDDAGVLPFQPIDPDEIDLAALLEDGERFADALNDYTECVEGRQYFAMHPPNQRGRPRAPRALKEALDSAWAVDRIFNHDRCAYSKAREVPANLKPTDWPEIAEAAAQILNALNGFIEILGVPGICQDQSYIWVHAPAPDPQRLAPIYFEWCNAPSRCVETFFGWSPPFFQSSSQLNWLRFDVGAELRYPSQDENGDPVSRYRTVTAEMLAPFRDISGPMSDWMREQLERLPAWAREQIGRRIPNFVWPAIGEKVAVEALKSSIGALRKAKKQLDRGGRSDQ
jgi:hypothetical protein